MVEDEDGKGTITVFLQNLKAGTITIKWKLIFSKRHDPSDLMNKLIRTQQAGLYALLAADQ
jgi:hypothetical protein